MNTDGYSFGAGSPRGDFFYASFHLDYDVGNLKKIYPLIELNWFYYAANGTNECCSLLCQRVDPDGDGSSNLLEYVYNRDPWQREQSPVMTVSVTSQGGGRALLLSFPHNRNATDVMLTYEGSSDLHSWTVAPSELVSVVVTSSETEQVTVRLPSSAPTYFVRVRATRTAP
jgi:hypothetical protein